MVLGWGLIASLIGGLAFSLIMASTGALSRIAAIAGSSSPVLGFIIHLTISVPIGVSYEASSSSGSLQLSALASFGGMLYGLVWWFLGPSPSFLFSWWDIFLDVLRPRAPRFQNGWHLLYGAITALVFFL
jgi:hypothetical protein